MTTAVQPDSLTPDEHEVLERFLSISTKKKERIFELARLYSEAVGDEQEEIKFAIAEVLFRKRSDLTAEPLEDETANNDAKSKLAAHRQYVANQIAKVRCEKGLKQDELAEKAGLPQSHISRLERGVHAPTHLTLRRIADALGVSVGILDPSFE